MTRREAPGRVPLGALAAASAALLPVVAAAQYKCVGADGRTSFQQVPCADAVRTERLDLSSSAPADPAGAREAAASTQRQLSALQWQSAVNQAITGGYPLVGMSVVDLDRALGAANGVDTADYGRGVEEQRIYRRGPRMWYVYTRAGVVTAIQNTAGGDPSLAARRNCPTRQELDNEATRLSSITLHPVERDRGQARLAQLRRECL